MEAAGALSAAAPNLGLILGGVGVGSIIDYKTRSYNRKVRVCTLMNPLDGDTRIDVGRVVLKLKA